MLFDRLSTNPLSFRIVTSEDQLSLINPFNQRPIANKAQNIFQWPQSSFIDFFYAIKIYVTTNFQP